LGLLSLDEDIGYKSFYYDENDLVDYGKLVYILFKVSFDKDG
jgi:hypothetical protein